MCHLVDIPELSLKMPLPLPISRVDPVTLVLTIVIPKILCVSFRGTSEQQGFL